MTRLPKGASPALCLVLFFTLLLGIGNGLRGSQALADRNEWRAFALDQPSQAQAAEGTWEMQATGVTLRSVHFIDVNRGWAVGDAGTMLRTSDGGHTWWLPQRSSSQGADLYGVAFVDAQTGWAVGRSAPFGYELIMKTTDGGASWPGGGYCTGSVTIIRAVAFVDANTGWAVGEGGLICKTTNGGTGYGWTRPTAGTTNTLNSVAFVDANSGWVVGDRGTILHTTDGGVTWAPQGAGTGHDLRSVTFVDDRTGWAVGDRGTILHTRDGGFIWQDQVSATNQNLTGVAFVDAQNGWAVGDGGIILKTTNGGVAWGIQASGTAANLMDVAFVDAQSGWAVGDRGTILHTADGGATWEIQATSITSGALRGVDFVDTSSGWVVGEGGVIFHTSDGGTAWIAQTSPVTNTLYSVSFVDTNIGWAVGDGGSILKTANGGTTWMAQSSGITTTLRSVAFVDAKNGWTVGDSGTVLRTTDGGITWISQASGTTMRLRSVAFLDANIGWAVGESVVRNEPYSFYGLPIQGNILRTSDGGSAWHRQETTYGFYSVAFAVGCSGWATGSRMERGRTGSPHSSGILHTSDGVTWSIQYAEEWLQPPPPLLYGIASADPLDVWAVGERGRILQTSDGGSTWQVRAPGPYLALFGVAFVDAQTGWGVGESGTILRYRGTTYSIPETYEAAYVGQSFPAVMYPGTQAPAWIELRNTGTATWYREGPNPVALGTSNPQDRASPFYTPGDWASSNQPTRLDQESAAPGEVGRFIFSLAAPPAEGSYREYFRPVAEGLAWFNDLGIYFDITVTSTPPANPYAAEFVDQSYPSMMVPGQWATARVELRNTGSATWYRSGPNPLMLGTSRPGDRPSAFYTSGNWISPSRPARLDQESVPLGGVGRFTFDLTAPNFTGRYQEYLRPVAEGLTWLNDLGLYFDITVTSTLQTSMSISPSCGGTLASNDPSRSTSIQAGARTVTDTAVLTYTYQLPQPTGDLVGIGHFFELTATQQGSPMEALSAPLTITVRYTDAKAAGVPENSLKLYRISAGQWVAQGITSTVDAARNVVTSTSAYLGSFGVLGRPPSRVYIPALTKGYSGW